MNYKLDQYFFNKYNRLVNDDGIEHLFNATWNLSKKQAITRLSEQLETATDFIWCATSFSLVTKMIFHYSRQDYTYLTDYYYWKTNGKNVFRKRYAHKMSWMTESVFFFLPEKLKNPVHRHSIKNIDEYTVFLLQIFEDIRKDLVGIDTDYILKKAVKDVNFTNEFSDKPESLSYKYLHSLAEKINLIN